MFNVLIILCGLVLIGTGYYLKKEENQNKEAEKEYKEANIKEESKETQEAPEKVKKPKKKWDEAKRNFVMGMLIVLLGLLEMLV